MERLTKRELIELKDGQKIVACNSKDDECNDYCMHGYCKWNDEALKKLKEYEDAEEQGLLIRLPCKVWDTLYEASRQWKTVITRTVAAIVIYNNNIWIRNGCGDTFEYGVEVFLTKEEAEKALERMGEDGNKSRTS